MFSGGETTGRILGTQDLVSDTRWSMMCTDGTSSALMMDSRRGLPHLEKKSDGDVRLIKIKILCTLNPTRLLGGL